ncbi:MAG: thermonuclease family protein [Candidatus Contendobacter sp.]|nr:thermonuclease family protein [Candidatus Contendobacter sp.]MDG4558863.1 thermonuclease family protein [Candidatus Contendobacter sp.]
MTTERMRVSYTPDGDTIRCWRTVGSAVEEVRVRLAYIDAPEIGQPAQYPYAVSARAYLRRLLALNEVVETRIVGQDFYGRLLAEVIRLRDYGNCGLRLVHGGYAALWQCPQSRGEYHAAQDIAQRHRLGIWRTPGPWQTPWLYRRENER